MIRGGQHGRIEALFSIFKNQNRSYPIRHVPDTVSGVWYRTRVRGWVKAAVFGDYFRERRVTAPRANERTRILYEDNCSGHRNTEEFQEALKVSNTVLSKFTVNATDKVQAADQCIISKIEDAYRSL